MSDKNDLEGEVHLESQIKQGPNIAVFNKIVHSRKW